MAKPKKKSAKKDQIIHTTTDSLGVEWAPLIDIKKRRTEMGVGITYEKLFREVRNRRIRCTKQLITKRLNNKEMWAVPLEDYRHLMKELETFFYIIWLHPNDDGSSRLKLKTGRTSNGTTYGRGTDYRTLCPDNKTLARFPMEPSWESPARKFIAFDDDNTPLAYLDGKEVLVVFKESNIKRVVARAKTYFEETMPSMQCRIPLKNDCDYDPFKNEYSLKAD